MARQKQGNWVQWIQWRSESWRIWPRVWQGLLLGLLCALTVRGAIALSWFDNLERDALNLAFRTRGAQFPDGRIVLVVADEGTVSRAGQWPLPRSLYARIVRDLKAGGARTIAFDVLLTERAGVQNDRALVEACRVAGNVIPSAAFYLPSSGNPTGVPADSSPSPALPSRFSVRADNAVRCLETPWVSAPLRSLLDAAPAVGHINVRPDAGGALQNIPHLLRYQNRLYPSLALAAAAHFLGRKPQDIVAAKHEIRLDGHVLPLDEEGETAINWVGGNRSFPTFSFDNVLSGAVAPETFQGRLVLIGVTAASAYDRCATPFSSNQPGVELQANAINDLLQERPLRAADEPLRDAIVLMMCLLTGAATAPRAARGATAMAGILVLIFGALVMTVFARTDFHLPIAAPLCGALLTYVAVTVFNYRRAWEESWRADEAMATLARGGALMASGRDRQSLERVIVQTAREALGAVEVLWAVDRKAPSPLPSRSPQSTLGPANLPDSLAVLDGNGGQNALNGAADEQAVTDRDTAIVTTAAAALVTGTRSLETTLGLLAREIGGGRAVLWPARGGEEVHAAHSGQNEPHALLQRVRLVSQHRHATPKPLPPSHVTSDNESNDALSALFDDLCAQLAARPNEKTPSSISARPRARTVVAASLSLPAGSHRGAVGADGARDVARNDGVLLAVGRRDGRAFTPRDAILLETLAEQAALALENLDYYERLSGRIEAANRDLARAYSLLSEQTYKLLAAIESIDDALIVTDENGRAVFVNATTRAVLRDATPVAGDDVPLLLRAAGLNAFADFFQTLPHGARGTLMLDPQHGEQQSEKMRHEIVRQVAPENQESRHDSSNSDADSRVYEEVSMILAAQFMPLLGDNGRVLGAMLIVADVTAQRELDRMKTDFVGFVAHELRTPLTTIMGYASLLQGMGDQIPAEQKSDMTDVIISHCKRLNRMISELLDVSRLEAGHALSLRLEGVDVVALCGRIWREHPQISSPPSSISVRFAAATRPIIARLDTDRFEQIITNLLSNAVKYSPDGGEVALEIEEQGADVVLRVRDQGMGMSEEQRRNLFQKFYRTKDAQERGIKGTGLGLFLVHQLVDAHGGTIEVETSAGGGSTFVVTLPKNPAPNADGFTPSFAPSERSAP